ncbi:MAG: four helix bundle protein [Candidatus Liptonbacteria bacterium]|nr:four helix bundle protein [Candidatus Liptonbacteria bacterium]MBI3114481.1 four helix bundle protein [Candidatus Harrisonbacteria bacterium]
MASIQKFEDLICWQRSRELANFVFNVTDVPKFKDFDLKRQIRRAAISPMSNTAEGFNRGTQAEFVDALFIAKGEVGEVRSQFYIAHDRGYIDMAQFEKGIQLTDECSRLIHSFSEKVKGSSRRGLQFKHVLKPDPDKELIKRYVPEVYKRMYGGR